MSTVNQLPEVTPVQVTSRIKLNGYHALYVGDTVVGEAHRYSKRSDGTRKAGFGLQLNGVYWVKDSPTRRGGAVGTSVKTLKEAIALAGEVLTHLPPLPPQKIPDPEPAPLEAATPPASTSVPSTKAMLELQRSLNALCLELDKSIATHHSAINEARALVIDEVKRILDGIDRVDRPNTLRTNLLKQIEELK